VTLSVKELGATARADSRARRVVKARLTAEGRRLIAGVRPQHARAIAELARQLEPEE